MKKRILVLSAIMFILSANLHAQVTIGSANAPKEGAILDLNSGAKGGLILSNVSINDPEVIPSGFAGMDGVDIATAKAQLPGALVYNLNENTCTGILVWDGIRWKRLGLEENPPTGTQTVKITSPEESQILPDDMVTFELESPPSDAKMYTWYVSDDGGATYEYAVTKTANSFSRAFSSGNHRVKVVLDNCRSLEASLEKSFASGSVSPSFGHTSGDNYIYVYGSFPYASSSDYVQDGLVLHFDGINNTAESDKKHSNTTNAWTDLISGYQAILTGTPGASAKWSGNGYTFDGAYFVGGLLPETTKNGLTPFGDSERTIESVFLTPDNQTDLNAAFAKAAGTFVYGGGTKIATKPGETFDDSHTYIGQIYHIASEGQPDRFIGINTRGLHDLNFTVSGANPLLTPNSINTVSSEYIPNPAGPDITGSACNFQGRLYTNSDLRVSGKLTLAGTAISDIPPCGIMTINAWTRIGRREAGILDKYKMLSVRLYNRALTQEELKTNSDADQLRFIAPPVVTIGGVPCTDVVVLSPNFLMCKVPPSAGDATGAKDLLVKSSDGTKTYTDVPQGYTYVDNSSFYISSIDPIIGVGGDELTLTGNKMDEISEIKVGDGVCAITSQPPGMCKCTIPTNPKKGDVDITITINNTDTYRFARMFEYQ